MISSVLLSASLLALIVGAALVLPSAVQPTVPFGVRVPPDRLQEPVLAAERRRYRQWVLVGCGGIAVAALVIGVLTGQPGLAPLATLPTVGVWLLVYSRAHVAIAAAKEREGWYAGVRQVAVADTALRTSPEPFPWVWALPALVLLVATTVIGIVQYPHLPALLPTHYGASGRANAFTQKSVVAAFGLVFVQAGLTALTIGAAWAWLRARPDLDPRRPVEDARWHRSWTGAMARASLVLVACLNLTFLLISWSIWQGVRSSLPVFVITLPVLAGVVVLLVVALRSTQERRAQVAAEAAEPGPVVRDDDRFWVGGLIYVNRDDPAFLVPRRFGVGITLNVGNPWSWLVLAVLAIGVAALFLSRHRA